MVWGGEGKVSGRLWGQAYLPALPEQLCHSNLVTTALLQLLCHSSLVTTALLQQLGHSSSATAALAQRLGDSSSATALLVEKLRARRGACCGQAVVAERLWPS